MWLKRLTPQNIVIGGAAGAFPPMVAYAAVTGSLSWSSAALFALIFVWTPPHFWALALVKSGEYAKAGIPMLPNVAGPDRTRRDILLYSLLLAPVGAAPWLMGFATPAYGALSIALGLAFVGLAWRVYRLRDGKARGQGGLRPLLVLDPLPVRAVRGDHRRTHTHDRGVGRMAVTRNDQPDGIVLTPAQQRSRRLRNIAIGLAIAVFVGLIYVVTIAKIGANVVNRPL